MSIIGWWASIPWEVRPYAAAVMLGFMISIVFAAYWRGFDLLGYWRMRFDFWRKRR